MGYNNRLYISDVLCLLIVIAGATLAGYGLARESYIYILPGIIATISGIVIFIGKENKYLKTLNIIIEALRNNDYSFRLPQKCNSLNRTFNEFADMLQKEKLSAVEQEKFYELVINSMSIGVIVVNDDGFITKCNDEALRLFNRNALTHISQLSSWDCIDKTLSELRSKEKRHLLIKSPAKELNITVHHDLITSGKETLRIYTINDIHSEIDRNEFDSWIKLTRVLTHEIMNGIAPISSLSDTMKLDDKLPHNIKAGLEAISTSSHSLINFVDSYRKFTHIPVPEPSLINVNELISKVQELNRNAHIMVCVEPTDLMIYADEALIIRVITNIVKNALEAIGDTEGGIIKIKAYCTETEAVKIEISNNGPAIPKEEADEIFVPFFTTKSNGSGIGLSISRQIMIVSGGNLSLSTAHDSPFATTFTLTFP